jgi:Tfp pilus assembly protein PilF
MTAGTRVASATTTSGDWERRDWWTLPGVFLAGALVFAGSLGHEFVYDDVMLFGLRPEFRSLADPWKVISSPWWENALYRPFTQLSLAFDGQMSGGTPGWFHLVNVILHATASAGVFIIARRWLAFFGAALAALLFAVHPVHVEAVANVVGRAEVYVAIFAIAAVALYTWDGDLAAAGDTSWKRWVSSFGTLGAVLFGLASKESAFAIPGILLIADWMDAKQQATPFSDRVRGHVVLWLGAVMLSLEWLMLRSIVIGDLAGDRAAPGLRGESFFGRVMVMAPVVLHYVRLFLFPRHLSADYSPNYIEADPSPDVFAMLGLIVAAGLVTVGVMCRNRWPVITFGLMWIGGTLLVVSNLIMPTGVLLAERSMYLPSVGVVLILGGLASTLRSRAPRVVAVVVVTVLALGALRTVMRVPVWKNASAFFPRLVQDAPASFRSLWVAGLLYYDLGDPARGEQLVRQALTVYPLFPNVWHDLGTKLQEQERWDEAAEAFSAAYRIDSTRAYAVARVVSNLIRAGDIEGARRNLLIARSRHPHDANVLLAAGELALAEQDPLRAMTLFRQSAWRDPDNATFHYRTAYAAGHAGYCPQLRDSVQRLATLRPNDERLTELRDLAQQLTCELAVSE